MVTAAKSEKALYYTVLAEKISASVNFPVLFYPGMTLSGLSSLGFVLKTALLPWSIKKPVGGWSEFLLW